MTACAHGMPSKGACIECMYDEGLGPPPKDPVTVRFAFIASYDGHCPGCNLPISAGQRILALSNDSYVHEGCANG